MMRVLSGFWTGLVYGFHPARRLSQRIHVARLIAALKGRRSAVKYFVFGTTPWD